MKAITPLTSQERLRLKSLESNMQTAIESVYENEREIASVMDHQIGQKIGQMLYDLPAPGNEDRPIKWPDVETVKEVNNRLRAVVEFLRKDSVVDQ